MPVSESQQLPSWTAASRLIMLVLVLWLVPVAGAADYAPDELIVRLKPGRAAELPALNRAVGAAAKRSIEKLGFYSVKLPKGADLDKTIARYRKNPAVEYAGPNHTLHITQLFPNDPVFYSGDEFWGLPQWGLYNDGYNNGGGGTYRADVHAPEAWDITTGSPNVVIAVLDTGVDYTHPDLAGKIWTNPGEAGQKATNGTDDDHNGFVDDWRGWDFVNDDNDPMDDHEIYDPYLGYLAFHHGSLVSGIAAAETDNWEGIAGVAWGCPIMALKVIGSDGSGSEDDAAAAVVYAVDNGAKVVNMSFAGADAPALHAAVDYAWQHNVLCLAASGNENSSAPTYPASYEHVLAVGASNEFDERCTATDWGSGGSNYGSYLDVVAPGSYIVSTGPLLVELGVAFEPYDSESGTSAAVPFVSGVAALVWSVHPTWTSTEVFYHICHTADDVGAAGWDIYTGWGRVNAGRAVAETTSEVGSIGAAKQLPSGYEVGLRGMVLSTSTGDLPGRIYMQEADRSSGILLSFDGDVPAGLAEGNTVDVLGITGSVSGERALLHTAVIGNTTGTKPKPLGMTNRTLGGGPFGLQGGVVNHYTSPRTFAVGLNNIGLLVTTTGRVKSADYGWFYFDDGSGLSDGPGKVGVYVVYGDTIAPPDINRYVVVTGISSCEFVPGSSTIRRRVLRPRKQDDIVLLR